MLKNPRTQDQGHSELAFSVSVLVGPLLVCKPTIVYRGHSRLLFPGGKSEGTNPLTPTRHILSADTVPSIFSDSTAEELVSVFSSPPSQKPRSLSTQFLPGALLPWFNTLFMESTSYAPGAAGGLHGELEGQFASIK